MVFSDSNCRCSLYSWAFIASNLLQPIVLTQNRIGSKRNEWHKMKQLIALLRKACHARCFPHIRRNLVQQTEVLANNPMAKFVIVTPSYSTPASENKSPKFTPHAYCVDGQHQICPGLNRELVKQRIIPSTDRTENCNGC